MTPQRLLAVAIWAAAAVIWADALAPGSLLNHTTPQPAVLNRSTYGD